MSRINTSGRFETPEQRVHALSNNANGEQLQIVSRSGGISRSGWVAPHVDVLYERHGNHRDFWSPAINVSPYRRVEIFMASVNNLQLAGSRGGFMKGAYFNDNAAGHTWQNWTGSGGQPISYSDNMPGLIPHYRAAAQITLLWTGAQTYGTIKCTYSSSGSKGNYSMYTCMLVMYSQYVQIGQDAAHGNVQTNFSAFGYK